MVDTIITRDKNWVYWKMLSCSPIEKKPVEPETFADAQSAAERLATSKRLRPVPMGAVPLDFLQPPNERAAFDEFRRPERYEIPELDGFQHKIADDDFEISTPRNDQAKAAAIAGKSSKSWRALRIASRCKLAAFDKIDDSQKIDVVFQELKDIDDQVLEDEPSEEDMPSNRDSIVVSGPPGAGKSALISKLIEEHKGVFVRVVRHTTREPAEGEVNGKDFHFVKAQEFNQLRDGDRLIEHGERDGADYGTSTKVIDAITESGKVPIVELDLEVRARTLQRAIIIQN
jgi:THO complex subunit 1